MSDNIRVQNMTSPRTGNAVPNQFVIEGDGFEIFQSYSTVIARRNFGSLRDEPGWLTLDSEAWAYSKTTARYRNLFTGLTTVETKARIKSGNILMDRLN